MKLFKKIPALLSILLIMLSFSNCCSTKQLQKDMPLSIGKAYCQTWVAGVEGGGSGLNIYIPIATNPNKIVLDSVCFKGKSTKLELEGSMCIGRFKTDANKKKDLVMSNDPKAEYGNEAPNLPKKFPFQIEDNQCVVSYKDGKKTKYFKIDNVKTKPSQIFPSAPPKKS